MTGRKCTGEYLGFERIDAAVARGLTGNQDEMFRGQLDRQFERQSG